MISKSQAMTEDYFHHGIYLPSGVISDKECISGRALGWRRNGRTQTWKTRPDEFRVSVKYGLYSYGSITHLNAAEWYTPAECPICNPNLAPERIWDELTADEKACLEYALTGAWILHMDERESGVHRNSREQTACAREIEDIRRELGIKERGTDKLELMQQNLDKFHEITFLGF